MILVVGACASGKRTYAMSCGYPQDAIIDAESLSADVDAFLDERFDARSPLALPLICDAVRESDCSVVANAQMLVKADVELDGLIEALLSKDMVLCTEVGAGVVPVDKGEREFRERAGRLSVALAGQAEKVVRMVCGIPVVLKG